MTEHVHGCLSCRPDMVPDFDRADPRFHDGAKCDHSVSALIDGVDPGYTAGIFEGRDGWVLLVSHGYDLDQIHVCPNCTTYQEYERYQVVDHHSTCVEAVFGNVEARHHCLARRKGAD